MALTPFRHPAAQAVAPRGLAIAPGFALGREDVLRLAAYNFLPGETVRLDPEMRFTGESEKERGARAALGGRDLVILETRVEPCEGASVLVTYVFEGVGGVWPARAFVDPRGYEHLYGGVISRDGQAWFVPFDDRAPSDAPRAAGEARRLASDLARPARWLWGVADPVLMALGQSEVVVPTSGAAEFLAEHEAEPSVGEFIIHPNPDGTWELGGSPWAASMGLLEIAAAEEAVIACLAAEGGGPAPGRGR